MCGEPSDKLTKVRISGAILNVCPKCAKFGDPIEEKKLNKISENVIIKLPEKKINVVTYKKPFKKQAPREEVTRLKYGGIAVPKSVDVSPSRRLDEALRNIARGATKASFKHKTHIEECLASEIMLAARNDANSFAISKKEEIERVAASAR